MEDCGEPVTLMEPLLVRESGRPREALADLSVELTAASTGLRRSSPDGVVKALSRSNAGTFRMAHEGSMPDMRQ